MRRDQKEEQEESSDNALELKKRLQQLRKMKNDLKASEMGRSELQEKVNELTNTKRILTDKVESLQRL